MGSDWVQTSLDDVAKLRNGAGIKQQYFSPKGTPLARISDFTENSIDLSACRYVDEEYAANWGSHCLKTGDVVIATVGSWPPNWSSVVGKVVRVPALAAGAIQNQNTCTPIPDPTRLDKSYLFYRLKLEDFAWHAANSAGGSANQARLPVQKLGKFRFMLPPLEEQRKIAKVLSTLDDKIALNHQINATLESMAQALFKSWFVDFDPVIDNALAAGNPIPEELKTRADARAALGNQRNPLPDHIRQQFPDRFVLTEDMEWVPQGWALGMFSDVALHVRMNAKTEEIAPDDSYVGLEHIGRKQFFLSEYGYGSDVESNKSRFQCGDLLFGKLRPYFHKVCRAPFGGVCSTDILVFRARERRNSSFMYMTAYREDFVEYANACSTGTRMPRANAKDLLKFPVALPSEEIQTAFENLTATIWEKGSANVSESTYLAKLRNTLLPKLLSGELRVPEAERKLEVAL